MNHQNLPWDPRLQYHQNDIQRMKEAFAMPQPSQTVQPPHFVMQHDPRVPFANGMPTHGNGMSQEQRSWHLFGQHMLDLQQKQRRIEAQDREILQLRQELHAEKGRKSYSYMGQETVEDLIRKNQGLVQLNQKNINKIGEAAKICERLQSDKDIMLKTNENLIKEISTHRNDLYEQREATKNAHRLASDMKEKFERSEAALRQRAAIYFEEKKKLMEDIAQLNIALVGHRDANEKLQIEKAEFTRVIEDQTDILQNLETKTQTVKIAMEIVERKYTELLPRVNALRSQVLQEKKAEFLMKAAFPTLPMQVAEAPVAKKIKMEDL